MKFSNTADGDFNAKLFTRGVFADRQRRQKHPFRSGSDFSKKRDKCLQACCAEPHREGGLFVITAESSCRADINRESRIYFSAQDGLQEGLLSFFDFYLFEFVFNRAFFLRLLEDSDRGCGGR